MFNYLHKIKMPLFKSPEEQKLFNEEYLEGKREHDRLKKLMRIKAIKEEARYKAANPLLKRIWKKLNDYLRNIEDKSRRL